MDDYNNMVAIAMGVTKAVWEKASGKIMNASKKSVDKFRVWLDTAFTEYLEKSYEKYSTIKTLLYRNDPKKLRDFFVTPRLQKKDSGKETVIFAEDSRVVRDFAKNNFIIMRGTGGIGKSMLMKHLFLCELREISDFYPVFFELKDINKQHGDYNLIDAIFENMNILAEETSKNAIKYALGRVDNRFTPTNKTSNLYGGKI